MKIVCRALVRRFCDFINFSCDISLVFICRNICYIRMHACATCYRLNECHDEIYGMAKKNCNIGTAKETKITMYFRLNYFRQPVLCHSIEAMEGWFKKKTHTSIE